MEIEIIEYKDEHQPVFKQLNLEWLDKYNLTETHDLLMLDDPRGTILDKGGFIWLAIRNSKIVGSAALVKEHSRIYELAKMAVAKDFQGIGISKLLIEICLQKAKEMGAEKVTLFSNHQLQRALKLYEKYGFRNTEVKNSPYGSADVRMELILGS
jgi:ribosomal protein S18 acetylase RimI-like enzyme